MLPDHWREVREIFEAALELKGKERTKFLNGAFVQNVPLRPTPSAPAAPIAQRSGLFGAMPGGMTGNMGGSPPPQGDPAPSRSPFGMLRHGGAPAAFAPNPAVAQPETVGFIAWDFRVLK